MEEMLISGERSLSSSQFQSRVLCTAQGLSQLGIGDGDSFALMLRNGDVAPALASTMFDP